jgi:hypothetical protein
LSASPSASLPGSTVHPISEATTTASATTKAATSRTVAGATTRSATVPVGQLFTEVPSTVNASTRATSEGEEASW